MRFKNKSAHFKVISDSLAFLVTGYRENIYLGIPDWLFYFRYLIKNY